MKIVNRSFCVVRRLVLAGPGIAQTIVSIRVLSRLGVGRACLSDGPRSQGDPSLPIQIL